MNEVHMTNDKQIKIRKKILFKKYFFINNFKNIHFLKLTNFIDQCKKNCYKIDLSLNIKVKFF